MVDTPRLDELAELRERAKEMSRLPYRVDQERRDLSAQVETRKYELRNYFARVDSGGKGSDAEKRKLQDAYDEARSRLLDERWDERIEGARAAGLMAEAQVPDFIVEHMEELVGELAEQTAAQRDRFQEAASALLDAHREYNALAGAWGELMRHTPLQPGERMLPPSAQLDEAVKAVSRLLDAGVPLFVPNVLAPTDPTIRTAA